MPKPLLSFPLLLGVMLLLGACAAESPAKKPQASTISPKSQSIKAPRPSRTVAAAPARTPAGARTDKGQTAVKSQEGAKPADGSKEEDGNQAERKAVNLVGLDQTQVAKVLGPPMAETEKAPGKVWRYWNSRCTVDVSLYLDVQSRSYRVLAYEVTNHEYSSGGRSDCLAELPKSNLQPAAVDGR